MELALKLVNYSFLTDQICVLVYSGFVVVILKSFNMGSSISCTLSIVLRS